ncbi:MAG: hypothetical protein E7158_06095 [Firmicutes bacterium]|nr:hypothetical protein [Bacillota bacterium]
MKDKKKQIFLVVGVLVLLLLVSVSTYAFFSANINKIKETETKVKTNELDITFNGTSEIDYSSVIPGDSFIKTFTVTNHSNRAVTYNIYMQNITNEFGEDLVYRLRDNNGSVIAETPLPETNTGKTYLKTNISIESQETKSYTMTIEYKYTNENQSETQGHVFRGTVGIDTEINAVASTYTENILNGADPVLTDTLIPVTLSSDGTVTYADINNEWYSYENKQWANAVILTSNPSQTYEAGDTISESDIESYFVWIPKYSYKLFHTNQNSTVISGQPSTLGSDAKEIEIEFGLTNTTDSDAECATPMTSGQSGNCADGKYMTHPAFISMNTNGLWVAKFETTGSTSQLTSKPSQTSLRSLNVKTFFELGYNYKRTNNSHMMKNTEWGAVAYLYHSEYGRCTNGTCEDIRINNNSDYLTGYAAADGTNQSTYPGTYGTTSDVTLAYNTTTGVKASTTGNITGVYDMSGGAWEYMASYRDTTLGSSGFDASTITNYDSKYFDVYSNSSNDYDYSKRILGDATGEMGPFYDYTTGTWTGHYNNWYADYSYFVYSSYPWFVRGGYYYYGVLAGPFGFAYDTGGSDSYFGFHLVLAPSN